MFWLGAVNTGHSDTGHRREYCSKKGQTGGTNQHEEGDGRGSKLLWVGS